MGQKRGHHTIATVQNALGGNLENHTNAIASSFFDGQCIRLQESGELQEEILEVAQQKEERSSMGRGHRKREKAGFCKNGMEKV